MRKASLVIIAMMIALMAIGCSDDDTPDPVAPDTEVTHLVVGQAIIRGYVSFTGMINTIYGQENEIDSILFGDSACTIYKVPSGIEGISYNYTFHYTNTDDTLWQSGDTVSVRFVTETETVTTNLKLLTVPEDTVEFLFPPQDSNYTLQEDIVIFWNRIPNADWYTIYINYDTSSTPSAPNVFKYDFCTDTSYTISASEHTSGGDYAIFVGAATGPVPGQAGNVNGQAVTGSIYSWAIPGVRRGLRVSVSGVKSPAGPEQVQEQRSEKSRIWDFL